MDEVKILMDAWVSHLTSSSLIPDKSRDSQDLFTLITHPDISLRQQAAELLADHHSPVSLEALSQLAEDSSATVRLTALTSLGTFPASDQMMALLLKGLKDSDYLVRATAAESLGNQPPLPHPALETLIHALADPNAMVRATAAEALGAQLAFLATPALQDRLLDSDQWVRYSAAESLHQIEPEARIWPLLMDANSKEDNCRQQAITALGQLMDRRAIPALVRMLNEAPELTPTVLTALQQFHDPLAISALVETALFTDLAHLREQALLSAQQLSLKHTLEALAHWLDSAHSHYTHRAIEVLHNLPTQATHPILHKALEHPDSWVRTVALLTLSEHKVVVPAQTLKSLLNTEQPQDLHSAALEQLMRYHPAESLTEIRRFSVATTEWQRLSVASNLHHLPEQILAGGQESFEPLLTDSSSNVREAALLSIGKMPYANCLPFLLHACQDEDSWVRQAAVAGLEQHPHPEATETLLQCLNTDCDFLVRARAAEALQQHLKPESRQGLSKALSDDKPSVRIQAIRSLFKLHQAGLEISPEQFQQMLQDSERNVLLTVLEQLQRHPQPHLNVLLTAHLSAEDPQIRSAAQQAYSVAS